MLNTSVYCMPGMAASPKIFEFLDLPSPYVIRLLHWIPPKKEEPLDQYAQRMCEQIDSENPILLGVSFGGVLVQEIAKIIETKKIIIVSSIKTSNELPLPMKMAERTKIHKLLPVQWIENIDALALFAFGKRLKDRISLYQKYLSERDPDYLRWAIDALVHWKQNETSQNSIHIHGNKDTVFPPKNLEAPVHFVDGGHAIILTQASWFNVHLPKLLA